MRSMFSGAGYVMVDNRASGGGMREDDILGCKHCQAAIDKSKWKENGAFCHACDGPICSHCDVRTSAFGCENFERKFARAIEDQYRREQFRKVLGT